MRYVPLAQADGYFEVAGTARLNWRGIEHAGVERFSEAVFKLSKLSRQQDDDTGWRQFLYPARRARNIVTTVPLPYNHAATGLTTLMSQLSELLPTLRIYAGDEAAKLGQEAIEAGIELADLDNSPLLETVLDAAGDSGTECSGLLLPMGDFLGSVRDYLSWKLGPGQTVLKPLTWHDLAASKLFARLIVIGPLYWYHDHEFILTSPRARQIELLKWAWYHEQPPTANILAGSSGGSMLRIVPPPVRSGFVITEGDERPEIDWRSVSRELTGRADGDLAEPILARPVLLAGGFAALFPEEGERLAWLLDPYATEEHRVVRVDVADLEPGHVVILRTSGGGDLIAPLADEILGADAYRLRELQRTWKAQLRKWVLRQGGLSRAAEELRRQGSQRADPQNLQNWLAERSLRPEGPDDWSALMRAASLEDRTAEIWQEWAGSAEHITRQACHSGGAFVRWRIPLIWTNSWLQGARFLPVHGGSVTAFRVEGFAPLTVRCAASHLMTPALMRNEWLS